MPPSAPPRRRHLPTCPCPNPRRYTIITYTSDTRGAGTDANVSCMLVGEKANTPMFALENSANNFEKGQRDEFVHETIDIGPIKQLKIGHDNKGLGPAWHLDHVEVIHQVWRHGVEARRHAGARARRRVVQGAEGHTPECAFRPWWARLDCVNPRYIPPLPTWVVPI